MLKIVSRFFLFILTVSFLAACGGGGSTTTTDNTPAPSNPTNPSGNATASAFTGSWNGTYSLAGTITTTNAPVSFNLTGVDNTGNVTGKFYSQFVAGDFSGVLVGVLAPNDVIGIVTNTVDGQTWNATLTKTSAGITIKRLDQGLATTGTGSCTAKPVMAFDLTGEYPVRYKRISTPADSTLHNGTIVLSYNGLGYTGVLIGATDGLKGKVNLFKTSGFWFLQITGTMGTYINSTNGILTQSSPITETEMTTAKTDGITSSMIAPLTCEMWGSPAGGGNSTTYEVNIYLEGTPP